MTFTTLTFLIFLAAVFALYWGVGRRRWQNGLLLAASYLFYGWWDWRFCGLMLASSLLDFGVGLGLNHVTGLKTRRALLGLGLAGNVGMLAFFKYFNFFAGSLRAAALAMGWSLDITSLNIVLPVGISFYTFQTMSYSIDVYRGKLRGTTRLIDYLAYVSFFPQLVAGPIGRATQLLPQFFQDRVFDHDRAVDGARQMLWGFFKKMVVADNLAPLVEAAYADPSSQTGAALALATVLFAFQIYYDFSAYSDIAIGVARLFGIELLRNFASPYFSQSMPEFWRRWHISLMTWFRDYVYVPLGGNRVGTARRVRNVLVTFLLSGLWHGASWNFVIWGLLNGLAVLPASLRQRPTLGVEDQPGGAASFPDGRTAGRMALTFGLVCFCWIFFRARTLADAWVVVRRIGADAFHLDTLILAWIQIGRQPAGWVGIAALVLSLGLEWVQRAHPHPLHFPQWSRPGRWAIYLGLSTAILVWGTFTTSRFIYFQF